MVYNRLTLHTAKAERGRAPLLQFQRKQLLVLLIACACCGQGALGRSDDPLARTTANARAGGFCSSDSSSCTSPSGRSAPGSGSWSARSSCCGISAACVSSICSLSISCNFSPWKLCSWNRGWTVLEESRCGSWNGCGIWSRSTWSNFHSSYGKIRESLWYS